MGMSVVKFQNHCHRHHRRRLRVCACVCVSVVCFLEVMSMFGEKSCGQDKICKISAFVVL